MGQNYCKVKQEKGPMLVLKIRPSTGKRPKKGPNDPNIFKAVFMAGGPGSGKSYVADKLLKGRGLKKAILMLCLKYF